MRKDPNMKPEDEEPTSDAEPAPTPTETRTRDEHLQWCKERALEYVENGDNVQALASFRSDLTKHPGTQSSIDICDRLGVGLAMMGQLQSAEQMRKFINDFN